MKTKTLVLALLAIFTLSGIAYAQPNNVQQPQRGHKKGMIAERREMAKDRFEKFFTEEQREQIKELRLETEKKLKPLRDELRELAAHQKTLTTADKPDMKAINANIDKMAKIKAEMAKIKEANHQKIRSMLTEEQRIKFDAMHARRGAKGHGPQKGKGFHGRGPAPKCGA